MAKLAQYRAKRNFRKTPEPRGKVKRAQETYPRFVVQKHDATRLHYDLRLELGGVFKSWAVTRGPSLDPGDKRLAVEVEDHPLEYGDFEGTIPEGEYGGGTVMLWDRGYWQPLDGGSAERALQRGELKFVTAGEKLKGSWVLVRMRHDRESSKGAGKRTNWLLIKHRDQWAKPGQGGRFRNDDRSVASGRSMAEIAKGRGKSPAPFMKSSRKRFGAGAVWSSSAKPATKSRRTEGRRAARPLAVSASTGDTVRGIVISKPDKVLWPERKGKSVTKKDLAAYLDAVAPRMLEHIAGRPCSIVRAPDGIEHQQFFQRHASTSLPSEITAVQVSGDRKPYLQVDTPEALVALGQVAAIEFHPWNCAPNLPEVPGRLVFDLDPAPEVAFEAVIDAAKELKDRLEVLGLVTFCKTTGGKGMHVVVPLSARDRDRVDWDEAKTFAHVVCAQMAADSPSRYLTKQTKKLRTGRIFLDYLRNDRMSTAVAPLSPRARAGATVSMPLAWARVRQGLDPKRYTIWTVPGLLKRSDPWRDYAKAARPLKPAIKELTRAER
jgi:bifunctional non-homologous end joining protein LigD